MTDQQPRKLNRLHKSAIAGGMAVSLIGGFEGYSATAYPDPATRGKPWTICYGHTGPEVVPGERASFAECKAILLHDLDKEADAIDRCIRVEMPDARYVAVLSLAHNIGAAGYCRSSANRLLNAGDVQGGCDALLQYNRAAGRVFPGLAKRRAKERELCLLPG